MLHVLTYAFTNHATSISGLLPAAAGTLLSHRLRASGVRESESIMNFSRLGKLSCICAGSDAVDHKVDRRDVCRTCGLEVIPADPRRLDALMSIKEIELITTRLRDLAIRARHVDIPSSVQTLDELSSFLEQYRPGRNRRPPRRPNAPVRSLITRLTN